MSGEHPRMNTTETRKQLLIAESELNRTLMIGDIADLKAGVQTLTARAKSLGVIASTVAVVAAGFATFHHNKSAKSDKQPSLLQKGLNGARLLSTLWFAFRPHGRGQNGKVN